MNIPGAFYGSKRHTILVVGKGAVVAEVTDALAALEGVTCVRQIVGFDPLQAEMQLRAVDHVVDMTDGLVPSFTLAMAALSAGISFTTANAMLMAVHGRVLQNAARGQQAYFGFQAAGFGLPLAEMMGAARPKKVAVSFVTAASVGLARMAFRNESLAHVSAHLKLQGVDLSDWGGKQTQARAMALRSLWFDSELRGAQLGRIGVDAAEPADVKRLRAFGLQPVYGAVIEEGYIYTGPMAVANGSALLNTTVQDVLVAETEQGDVILAYTADETTRVLAGIVADMRSYLRSSRPALAAGFKSFEKHEAAEPVRAYVRMPYAAREVVLAVKPEILSEKVDGDGLWQAVIEVAGRESLQIASVGGMVYPVSGAWEPPAAGSVGLRMVG